MGIRKKYALLTLFMAAGGCASAGRVYRLGNRNMPSGRGFTLRQVTAGGLQARYTLFVPRNYTSRRKWPLILFLNGSGQVGRDGRKPVEVGLGPAVAKRAATFPFIVIFAQTPNNWGANSKASEMAMAELAQVERHFSVNRRRVYLTGLSLGGFGTWALGAKFRRQFAALAPVAAPEDLSVARRLTHMPIWCFQNSLDLAVWSANATSMCNVINLRGGHARLTMFNAFGHNSWHAAYNDNALYAWLLRHKLPRAGAARYWHARRRRTLPPAPAPRVARTSAANLIFAGN